MALKVPKEFFDGQDIIILFLDRSRKLVWSFHDKAREFLLEFKKNLEEPSILKKLVIILFLLY